MWKDLGIGAAPNQLYLWAQSTSPFTSFAAAPLPSPSNAANHLTELLLKYANPRLATNGMGAIEPTPKTGGCAWVGIPFMAPFLQPAGAAGQDFVIAGLFPNSGTN